MQNIQYFGPLDFYLVIAVPLADCDEPYKSSKFYSRYGDAKNYSAFCNKLGANYATYKVVKINIGKGEVIEDSNS